MRSSSSLLTRTKKELHNHGAVYIMLLPVIAYFIIFHYLPMGGLVMAFQDYRPNLGYFRSNWVGFKHFQAFFASYYFGRLLSNTLLISIKDIIFSFPASILFALLLNELRLKRFKKTVQTISYLPYFISMVVVCGLVKDFTDSGGAISNLVGFFTGSSESLISNPKYFQTIFVGSNIWQNLGYNSIVFISALAAIDMELYEAARIDGAGRLKQTWHITLPGISGTIIIMLLLRVGQIMTVSYQKIILLYSPATYETGDVILSFVYRKGLVENDYSYSTAVGMFNSVVNLLILAVTNWVSKKFSETSLW